MSCCAGTEFSDARECPPTPQAEPIPTDAEIFGRGQSESQLGELEARIERDKRDDARRHWRFAWPRFLTTLLVVATASIQPACELAGVALPRIHIATVISAALALAVGAWDAFSAANRDPSPAS